MKSKQKSCFLEIPNGQRFDWTLWRWTKWHFMNTWAISSLRQNSLIKIYWGRQKFLSDQARKAAFSMSHKIKTLGELQADIMFNSFDVLIKRILIYGSDVWGLRSELWGTKCILWYFMVSAYGCLNDDDDVTSNILLILEFCTFLLSILPNRVTLILLRHFNFAKYSIQYRLLGSTAKITVMLRNDMTPYI